MPRLTQEDLEQLLAVAGETCISIYMPAERAGRETRKNSIRFKNLVRQADDQLHELGHTEARVHDALNPARELIADNDFWQHQSDGLAAFIAPGVFITHRLPYPFEELAVVDDHFYIKPLVRLFTEDGRFYVLALSQKQVRLLLGTHYSIEDVTASGAPTSLEEALRYEEPEKSLQWHALGPAGPDQRPAQLFHGHGVGVDDRKNAALRFCRIVDRALHKVLRTKRSPMVLAAVDTLHPLYRQANTYDRLLEKGVTGNPDLIDNKTLHDRAWKIVEPLFLREREEAIDKFKGLHGRGERTSDDIRAILPAAQLGRVETLLVDARAHQWGEYDTQSHAVTRHEKRQTGDTDLLDRATVLTLANHGKVYAVDPEKMPDSAPVAAVYRW